MKALIIILLTMSLISTSCIGAAQVANQNLNPSSSPALTSVPKDLSVSLERTPCGGFNSQCPVYKLKILNDGTVIYDGQSNVKRSGIVKSTINRERLQQLVAEIEETNYFSLKSRYSIVADGCEGSLYDSSSVNTSIIMNGKSKNIFHYKGCVGAVPELTKLEDSIDEIVNSKQWIE